MVTTRSQTRNINSKSVSNKFVYFTNISLLQYLPPSDFENFLQLNKIIYTGITSRNQYYIQNLKKSVAEEKKKKKILKTIKFHMTTIESHQGTVSVKEYIIGELLDFIIKNLEFMKFLGVFEKFLETVKMKILELRNRNHLVDDRFNIFLE